MVLEVQISTVYLKDFKIDTISVKFECSLVDVCDF